MQASRERRKAGMRSRYSSRPFVVSTLLITLIATYAFVFGAARRQQQQQQQHGAGPRTAGALFARNTHEPEPDCRLVHQAADQCAFILAYCEDDEAGLLHYLSFYYCTLGTAKPVAFAIMAAWLGLLFTTIGIAASDFFSINLSTIASVLGLSESLAGVTFLAFGNGSPDVFSTFAAMKSNSGSMAIGELIGAAGFITAVVAGSMALVREFKVSKRTFVRDILFFIAAIGFTVVFLADGELQLWECLTMIGFYFFYVAVVVGWHWFSVRRRRQRMREIAARTHLYAATGQSTDEIEPYRDLPDDDEAAPVGNRVSRAAEDISALERAPRIELDGGSDSDEEGRDAQVGADMVNHMRASRPAWDRSDSTITPIRPSHAGGQDFRASRASLSVTSLNKIISDEERGNQVASEMTSSMRVNRPRWGRSNSTITPIRPSLVGALEFRAALSSLNRVKNMHMEPLPERQYSEHANQLSGALERSVASIQDARGRPRVNTLPEHAFAASARERALSHGNPPLNLEHYSFPPAQLEVELADPPRLSRASSMARTVDGRLAPPTGSEDHAGDQELSPKQQRQAQGLQLQIPTLSRRSSGRSSPSLSPFPGFVESPAALTPAPHHGESSAFAYPDPPQRIMSSTLHGLDDFEESKPVKWWPYNYLPPPHVLLGTFFPTLLGWRDKSWWDKIISLISVPTIFVLVVTLPVVETETEEENSEPELVDTSVVTGQANAPMRPETEWQEYRRRTQSVGSRSLSPAPLALVAPESVGNGGLHIVEHAANAQAGAQGPPAPAKQARSDSDYATLPPEAEPGWNRWLVIVQLFTGPLFVAFILWANIHEDMENPVRTLLRMIMYALIISLCLLGALLLLTTPDKTPKYHFILCFLGFIISIAWISTVAGEVVGVLKAFGVILGISEAILGLTIFAVGNSLGDLVADVTVARLGYPVMALAACFGGPMLNILLGVGAGGAIMGITSANKKHQKHPDRPVHYKPYHIEVSGTLMISAITVLLTLVILLIAVPLNNWIMSRKIGWGLIALWSVSTAVNLVVELTGTWSDLV